MFSQFLFFTSIYKAHRNAFRFVLVCVIGFGFGLSASGQSITITGKVVDKQTEEALPFANVYIKGKPTTGITTDYEGNYTLTIDQPEDSIGASSIGYITVFKPLQKNNSKQMIVLPLDRSDYSLMEVVIKPGENPANILMRKVIANKGKYNKNKLNSYGYEVYNKMEIDLEEINDKFKNRKVFKPFKFVFNNMDSVSEEKPFLPFFMTETMSDFHHRKNPLDNREIIKASKVSGVNNASVTQFLGSMYVQFDIFEDWILLLNQSFVSPISNVGLSSYRYYIVDSAFIGNKWCKKIQFMPRRKGELTFEGDMWIADSAFAVKQLSMKISKDADVNFVKKISIYNEFESLSDSIWLLKKDKVVINFIHAKNAPGLIGRKTTSYSKFNLEEDQKTIDSLFKKQKADITIKDNASEYSNADWQKFRHDSLSKNENRIYGMIDTLKTLPVVKSWLTAFQTIYLGYYDIGPLSIGNFWTFLDVNPVEGWRFKYGMGTSNKFSKHIMLNAYVAYGIKDRKVKYGGEFLWIIRKKVRESLSGSYKDDVTYTTDFDRFYSSSNILNSIPGIRRVEHNGVIPYKIVGVRELKLNYFKETNFGYSITAGFANRFYKPLGKFEFNYATNGNDLRKNQTLQSFTTTEFSFTNRFALQEKFISGEFNRTSLGSKYPVLVLRYTLGLKRWAKGDFNYHKLSFAMDDVQPCGPLGRLYWRIEVGKTFGRVPFLLLYTPDVSENYIYNWSGFNTSRQYEFVMDRYINILINHHFSGLLFNRIPGIRKLKWRESFQLRMLWGDMTAANRSANFYNALDNSSVATMVKFKTPNKVPFIEIGTGIENIFKVFRVDVFWRVTHQDKRGSPFSFRYGNFGVRLGFQLQF